MKIREANPYDAKSIVEVHKSDIATWYLVRGDDLIEADYEELSADDRWLHGGPWMSYDTCIVHLSNFPKWGGKIFVGILDDKIVGEIEVIRDEEVEPYGEHLYIYVLMIHKDNRGKGVGTELIKVAEDYARDQGLDKVLVSSEERSIGFYQRIGYKLLEDYKVIEISSDKNIKYPEKIHYEPLTKINKELVRGRKLVIGRFHNTIATLYNISTIYPLQRIHQKYFFFKLYDDGLEHVIVIRKSDILPHLLYGWIDVRGQEDITIIKAIKWSLFIAKRLGIRKIMTCVPSTILNKLKSSFINIR